MAKGGSFTQRVDITDSYDPRLGSGRAAKKGTLFRYIPNGVGTPVILVKQDDTGNTNWVEVGASGSADTASNLGTGQGVFAAKVANDFQFKSLVAGTNVSITATGTELTINATGGGGDFANKTLSNLDAPTAINQDLDPDAADTRSIGSSNAFAAILANSHWVKAGGTLYGSLGVSSEYGGNLAGFIGSDGSHSKSIIVTSVNSNWAGERSGDVYIRTGNAATGAKGGDIIIITSDDNASGATGSGDIKLITLLGSGTQGGIFFNEKTLAGASNGWVWTLIDQATGEGGWVAPSGGAPTGDPNRLAYFDNLGVLSFNSGAKFDASVNAMSLGLDNAGAGTLSSTAQGSLARGSADTGGSISATAAGASAAGVVTNNGIIEALGAGSSAFGFADNGAIIRVQSNASLAMVYAPDGTGASIPATAHGCAIIGATGATSQLTFVAAGPAAGHPKGSAIIGFADSGSTISANGRGDLIGGYAANGSQIRTTGSNRTGRFVWGYADNASTIQATSHANLVMGYALGGNIAATGTGGAVIGRVANAGTLSVGGTAGALAHGYAFGASLAATGIGACSAGYSENGANMACSGTGAKTFGYAADTDTSFYASGNGAMSQGEAVLAGRIESTNSGSHAAGKSSGTNSKISALGIGSVARGSAEPGAVIQATVEGAKAYGYALNASAILATGYGSLAQGASASTISAGGAGSIAAGNVATAFGSIVTTDDGCMALGSVAGTGSLQATALGAIAHGYVDAGGSVQAAGRGSSAQGVSYNAGLLTASGLGSMASGGAVNNNHTASGDYSSVFGYDVVNPSFACFAVGRYASLAGETSNAWVDTEHLFVVGNGANSGSLNNAFSIYKDGKMETTGAQRHKAIRSVSADTTLSARTDRTLMVDTAAAAGAVSVTMPAGEDGLEFFVKDSGANATVNNITFVPDGSDTMEAGSNITNSSSSRHFQFLTGKWYVMNMP